LSIKKHQAQLGLETNGRAATGDHDSLSRDDVASVCEQNGDNLSLLEADEFDAARSDERCEDWLEVVVEDNANDGGRLAVDEEAYGVVAVTQVFERHNRVVCWSLDARREAPATFADGLRGSDLWAAMRAGLVFEPVLDVFPVCSGAMSAWHTADSWLDLDQALEAVYCLVEPEAVEMPLCLREGSDCFLAASLTASVATHQVHEALCLSSCDGEDSDEVFVVPRALVGLCGTDLALESRVDHEHRIVSSYRGCEE